MSNRVARMLPWLAVAAIGAVAGGAGYGIGRAAAAGRAVSPWMPVATVAGIIGSIVVHELGHVFAGAVRGFTCHWLVLGPLRIARVTGRVRFERNPSLALWGGAALVLPDGTVTDERKLRRDMAWVLAGGPLASIALAAGLWAFGGSVLFATTSFAIGLATLIPGTLASQRSDGGRLLDLARATDDASRDVRIVALSGAMATGHPPASWHTPWLRAFLEEPPEGRLVVMGLMFAYLWAIDRDDDVTAAQALERSIVGMASQPASVKASIHHERAWFIAVRQGDAGRAAQEMAAAGDGLGVSVSTRHRALAALQWARGEHDAAVASVTASVAALDAEHAGGAVALLTRMAHQSIAPSTSGAELTT